MSNQDNKSTHYQNTQPTQYNKGLKILTFKKSITLKSRSKEKDKDNDNDKPYIIPIDNRRNILDRNVNFQSSRTPGKSPNKGLKHARSPILIRTKDLQLIYQHKHNHIDLSPNTNPQTHANLNQTYFKNQLESLKKLAKPFHYTHLSPEARQCNGFTRNNYINKDRDKDLNNLYIKTYDSNKNRLLNVNRLKLLDNTNCRLYSKDSRETSESNKSQSKCIIESNLNDCSINDSRRLYSNRDIESIEEVHFAFVALSLESKKVIDKQEKIIQKNTITNRIFCFNTVVSCEERDIND